eukprot:6172431-Amphidinium_carterae.1
MAVATLGLDDVDSLGASGSAGRASAARAGTLSNWRIGLAATAAGLIASSLQHHGWSPSVSAMAGAVLLWLVAPYPVSGHAAPVTPHFTSLLTSGADSTARPKQWGEVGVGVSLEGTEPLRRLFSPPQEQRLWATSGSWMTASSRSTSWVSMLRSSSSLLPRPYFRPISVGKEVPSGTEPLRRLSSW